ncbi:BRCT domain-containing protein [Serratia sp. PAMC26656]|uniref:BRCT domain-containing protein n=1 Tax=Serratia sp. PAMC26656 TaxID=2775909 RepID=UPI0018F3DAD2|nr:BRCT domain-containing protein [Serratia sp. PAMC26656]MBJ7892396.1 BRCT domain-containing protein [Serratia sp. PAMC26656]
MKTICFTGFSKNKKSELTNIALSLGYSVSKDVTKGLDYLCCGDSAGPSKINKAKQNNSALLSEVDFYNLPDLSARPSKSTQMTIYDSNEFLDIIWSAIDKRDEISVFYHGGTSSGKERRIIPLTLLDNFTLRAVDLSSVGHPVKSFSVGKIEISGVRMLDVPIQKRNMKSRKKYTHGLYRDISDVFLAFNDTLLGMGWHVATYNDGSGLCNRLDVCDFFKNGKPRKSPVVSLRYQPENLTRPFVCRCPEIEFISTYAHLDNAAEMFITLAYASSAEDAETEL